MEKGGVDWPDEKLKSQTAIRCAKAAFLLASLKSASKNSTTDCPQLQDEEKIEMLKIELVKERQKLKKLRHWIGMLLLSYFLFAFIYPLVLNSI